MDNALEIKGLCKQYEGFALENVSFTLPRGAVMGFIGENGAGKTTTIKSILNLIHRDAGAIRVLGLDNISDERAVKERIGVVLEDGCFLNTLNARQVDTLMGKAYKSWQPEQFFGYVKRFGIDERKKIKDYSKGMRMKLSIAAALSHGAELLIMDEPTSGLDPVVRDEVLDLLRDFVAEPGRAILMSSHITSDLERIADRIVCIDAGRIVFDLPKDVITDEMGVARCRVADLEKIANSGVVPDAELRYLRHDYGIDVLVPDRFAFAESFPEIPVDRMTIDDYMTLTLKGGVR
jgi:ABC-2 type transport system ATP-binding protein